MTHTEARTLTHREPLMRVREVSKSFGKREVLSHVNVDIFPHEILAIVGDNGAGKSTLAKIISGFYVPSAGTLHWHGNNLTLSSIGEAQNLGIMSLFQDPATCENLDVTSNIFLGQEIVKNRIVLDKASMRQTAGQVLASLMSPLSPDQRVEGLSNGQRQTVLLARAMLGDPELIVLDEPTASLSVTQTAEVLDRTLKLRSLGISVIFISHNLPDIFAISDRIMVLRHGKVSGIHAVSETSYEEIIAEIAGAATAGKIVRESALRSMQLESGCGGRRTLSRIRRPRTPKVQE